MWKHYPSPSYKMLLFYVGYWKIDFLFIVLVFSDCVQHIYCIQNSTVLRYQWWLCCQCSRMEGHSRTTKFSGDEEIWDCASTPSGSEHYNFFKGQMNHAVYLLYIYWFSSCRSDFVWADWVSSHIITALRVYLLI